MTSAEVAVLVLAVALTVLVQTSAPWFASRTGALLSALALLAIAAVVLHQCGAGG